MNLARFNRNMMPTMGRHQQQRHSGYGDDELSCKICLGLYSDRSTGQRPRTLPCRHTFCESCLQQLFKPRPNERRHQRKQWYTEEPAGTLRCPLCKYRSCLGPTSVQGLPVNPSAIQHSGRMSDVRSQHFGRQLHDLEPRSAFRDVKVKRNSNVHVMSCGTTGSRVTARRCENVHPSRWDDEEYDIWELSRSRNRSIRFADDDQLSTDIEQRCCVGGDDEEVDQSDDVFVNVSSVGVFVGQFGQNDDTLCSPTCVNCAGDGRLLIVDADGGSVQIFAVSGDCLSSFRLSGARAACFVADAGRGELLAVTTSSGVSLCDVTGRVDKHLPLGTDVVDISPLRGSGGVFVAAHPQRLTVCDSYKPTAMLRSIGSVRPLKAPIGHSGVKFTNIVALASTAVSRVYVVDAESVLAVDINSGTLLQSITPAGSGLLREPRAVAVDLVTSSVLVGDSTTRRVLQFDAEGGRYRCVAELPDDIGKCVSLAAGPHGHDGHQVIYLVCRGPGSAAQVLMYQI